MNNSGRATSLDELDPGARGKIVGIGCPGPLKCRLMDMGLTPGTEVRLEGAAPLGDPIIICARGCRLGLRRAEAAGITVSPCPGSACALSCQGPHRHRKSGALPPSGPCSGHPRRGVRRWRGRRNGT